MPQAALPVASTKAAAPRRLAIAVAGAVSLAVAMGIGRFAFTPLLPMMLHDGVIDLHAASWLASSNYLGYLVGALLCTFEPFIRARLGGRLPPVDGPLLVRTGLIATGLLTLGMALPLPALWPIWRFAAGVASAMVFVYTSGWCLSELAQRGSAALGAAIFAGPGAGIVLSGLFASAMVGWRWRASTGWAIHGLLALALTACVWRTFRPGTDVRVAVRIAEPAAPASVSGHGEMACLALAYGLAGFGYIVTATFLPVIARVALPESSWLDLFWPIFGAGVMFGALAATRSRISGDLRPLLAACYVVQALGIATSLWRPSLAGFALGSLLLGIPFTAITFFAMQEVRRLRPRSVAPFMGLLTAMYGIGQIVGPPLVAQFLKTSRDAGEGFSLSLTIAAVALLIGALFYLVMAKAYPLRQPDA